MKVSNSDLFAEYQQLLNDNDGKDLTRNDYRNKSVFKNSFMNNFDTYGDFIDSFYEENSVINIKLEDKVDIQPTSFEIDYEKLDLISAKKVLYKQNSKIASLSRDNKLLTEHLSNEDEFISNIADTVANNINVSRKPITYKCQRNFKSEDGTLLLHISDAHLGEVVNNGNGINDYNTEIGLTRIQYLFDEYVSMLEQSKYNDAHILVNGDMISGSIHDELERTNDLTDTECIIKLSNVLIENIIKVAEVTGEYGRVTVDILVGNHARTKIGKPYVKNKIKDNWEYLLGMIVKSYFDKSEMKKIEICVPDTWYKLRYISGVPILQTHGDCLGGSGGGFPGLPIAGLAQKAAKMYGIMQSLEDYGYQEVGKFDYVLVGHFHKTATIPLFNGGKMFVNGTIKGTDEYSLGKMTSLADCEQTVFNIKDGEIKSVNYIKVGEV